jgi:prepilin peptidase CpaA
LSSVPGAPRRIPNWLTVPALFLGIAANTIALGWAGAKEALLGAGLGLGLLLPFVLLRSLGGGDWKLVGGMGAFFGPSKLVEILIYTLIINGIMGLCLIIWKRRLLQTLRNLGRMFAAFFSLHLPGSDLTIDNPEAAKVPFGVAAAIAIASGVFQLKNQRLRSTIHCRRWLIGPFMRARPSSAQPSASKRRNP